MKPMTVRHIVKQTGLSRETLRYYEKEGLLGTPARSASGYRIFSTEDLETVQFILKTKQAGFRIKEIRELISLKDNGGANCRLGRELALNRIHKVDEQIASLKAVRAVLADFADQCEREGLDQPCSLSFNLHP